MRLNRVLQKKLNRVLLLVAVAGMSMSAMVFTISCSDGENGKDGAICKVSNAEDGGYDVFCGDVKAGTLTNGPRGANGQQGQQGAPGIDNHEDCELGPEVNGSFQVFCQGALIGVLEGCNISNPNEFETSISCAGSAQISMCGGKLFNPSENTCVISGATAAPTGIPDKCGPTEILYNSDRQYCGYASKAAYEAEIKTPIPLNFCGAGTGAENKVNEAVAPDWEIEGGWKDEYCRVEVTGLNSTTFAPDTSKSKGAPTKCGDNMVKINDGAWKGEYCGFENPTAVTRTVVSNACGDGGKPDSVAFGRKYCYMKSKTSKYSELTEDFCEEGISPAVIQKAVNKVDKAVLTPTDYKKEYCGFSSKNAADSTRKSLLVGICDDGTGPNADSWGNDYCTVLHANKTLGTTTRASGSAAYCMKDADSRYETAGSGARVNENKWNNEYCGYSSKAAYEDESPTKLATGPVVLRGVCTNGTAPNESSWNNGYCQGYRKDFKDSTKAVGGIDAEQTIYCGIATVPANSSSKGRMNDGSWKDQYCAYTSLAAFNSDLPTVTSGSCDLPNAGTTGENQLNYANRVKTAGYWPNDYCQVKFSEKLTGKTTLVGIPSGNNVTKASMIEVFCLSDLGIESGNFTIPGTTTEHAEILRKYQNAGTSAMLNNKTWQKHYCGYSSNDAFDAKVQSRLTTYCSDSPINAVTDAFWKAEYCQAKIDGTTTKVGITGTTGTDDKSFVQSTFCYEVGDLGGNSDEDENIDLAAAAIAALPSTSLSLIQLNANTWKGEYCFLGDHKREKCYAGQEPAGGLEDLLPIDTELKSTDPRKCW